MWIIYGEPQAAWDSGGWTDSSMTGVHWTEALWRVTRLHSITRQQQAAWWDRLRTDWVQSRKRAFCRVPVCSGCASFSLWICSRMSLCSSSSCLEPSSLKRLIWTKTRIHAQMYKYISLLSVTFGNASLLSVALLQHHLSCFQKVFAGQLLSSEKGTLWSSSPEEQSRRFVCHLHARALSQRVPRAGRDSCCFRDLKEANS